MKALKRVMAGEYSRELGTKVLAGQKRLAELGFKQGGPPGYGFGRMLVGPELAQPLLPSTSSMNFENVYEASTLKPAWKRCVYVI